MQTIQAAGNVLEQKCKYLVPGNLKNKTKPEASNLSTVHSPSIFQE